MLTPLINYTVVMSKITLSGRENQCLTLLAAGFTQAEISQRLGVAQSTISGYISRAARKLNCRTQTATVLRAYQTGAISPAFGGLLTPREAIQAEGIKAKRRAGQ